MKYLKKFNTHAEYELAILELPNVSYCVDNNDVHYNPDPYNGHTYVDLELPSGTKWATMNVGANGETNAGLYFAWGETQGYADTSTKAFTWNDYKYGTRNNPTKYNSTDSKTVLDLEDDAARANWGGKWHIPTAAQLEELLDTNNCTNSWTTINGVAGRLFTSVKNGNTLFFPAVGNVANGIIDGIDIVCFIWSNSLDSTNVTNGDYGYFDSSSTYMNSSSRCFGFSVRAVVD